MATTTYEPIATTTLTGTQANIEFTSISGAYTDFILTGTVVRTAASDIEFVLGNGSYDTGSNYSFTYLYGTGSAAGSGRTSNQTKGNAGYASSTNPMSLTIQAQNYSNTSTFKTLLVRNSPASGDVSAVVNLWRSTSAINQIKLTPNSGSFGAGTSLTLYGIANAAIGAPKATGGIITYDNTYYYHTFGASGTFTPQQSLTADVLVVAGGGGGGSGMGGGGGAGGYVYLASQSLSATGYSVTVGSGGPGNTSGSQGNGTAGGNSSFNSTTAIGGGYGGQNGPSGTGGNGGSGGGGGGGNNSPVTGGTATSGQGNIGGSSLQSGPNYPGGGGGGAGSAGSQGTSTSGGAGGNGLSTLSSWGLVTGTGQNVNGTVYYAAGGGGGTFDGGTNGVGGLGGGGNSGNPGTNGLVNTGSGGGGGNYLSTFRAAGNGGSGVVIVRYLR